MNLKTILCLVLATALVYPVMAKGKKGNKGKAVRGEFVSITEETIVVKVKGEEKTYTITEDTKILNEKGEEVEREEFQATIVLLKIDKDDSTKVTEVKAAPAKKKKEKKIEEPKEDPEDDKILEDLEL